MTGKKFTELDAASSVASTDIIPVDVNPGGSPDTQKATIAQVIAAGIGTGATQAAAGNHTHATSAPKTISVSFNSDGDAYFVAHEAMTIGSTTYEGGSGTLSYEKAAAADTTSFSADPLPVTLAQGDVLKVTCASLSGYKSVTLVRTA